MRLIDADVFKTEYENLITWVSHRAEKAKLREFIKDIQNQPTVKAIPIEWIEKWLNNIANNKKYKNKYVELTEEVKRIVYRQAAIIRIPCISDMIEDWEKENE